MKTQNNLTTIAHEHYHPRKEPKYWEAWQCGVCIGRDNSVALLRNRFGSWKGVTFRCVR